MTERAYNFAAGPGVLPLPVLEEAQRELLSYEGAGMSVMEMSHRGRCFGDIIGEAKARFSSLLSIPEGYEVLLLQGGATTQFSAVPLNLLPEGGHADYAVTGNFSGIAAKEAARYGGVHLAGDGGATGFARIPGQSELSLSADAAYFHYCANNTVYGTAWSYVPETPSPLVCDMSSEIMSHPVPVSRYGLIYAGAQKNMAPAGLTVVIVRRDLLGRERADTPKLLGYKLMADSGSLHNTPPCWSIYIFGLVMKWLEAQGGLTEMDRLRRERSKLIYDVLDSSSLYIARAEPGSRSCMNVTFRTPSQELDDEFAKGAERRGLLNIKGHKVTGGIRASLYNAMPMEGAAALAAYMKDFEVSHRV